MPNQPIEASEAGALALWAQAITRARIPASLQILLLALLAALSMATAPRRMLRLPRKDWFLSAYFDTSDGSGSDLSPYDLRRLRQARAELGWLLRGHPNRGMSMRGYRTPEYRPHGTARAPPIDAQS